MNSDFISAVCPNCGGKLQVDPSVDTLICQFCGTEHIIRRNVSGDVTLEAFARCPLCKRNDRSEKVSAILGYQTAQSKGTVPQQRVYTVNGHTYSRTVNVPVETTQTSDLARRLAPLPPPVTKSTVRLTPLLLAFAVFLLIAGLCGFTISIANSNSSNSSSVVGWVIFCGIIPASIAVGLFIIWYFLQKKEKEKTIEHEVNYDHSYKWWQYAMSRWEKLYYCGRDDIVFIPGEKTSSTVTDMYQYIYSVPKK